MTADLRVDLDLTVRRGRYDARPPARLHARHELHGSTVQARATADGVVEDIRFGADHWPKELTRACRVRIPHDAPTPPDDDVALPWDLVVSAGAALAERRPDLYDALVARAEAPLREPLRRVHRAVGRLRAVGTIPARARTGWVSWLLFADGWHALTPYVDRGHGAPRPALRLEPRRPEDLARDVARWATGVFS
jgi:hypothetical protein